LLSYTRSLAAPFHIFRISYVGKTERTPAVSREGRKKVILEIDELKMALSPFPILMKYHLLREISIIIIVDF
jgi:hypothetical protein